MAARLKTVGFIASIAVGTLAMSLAAGAQPKAKVPRIGWLVSDFPPLERKPPPFMEGLRELGWIEGRNIVIERRYAEENHDRLQNLAAELVRLKVDVIVAGDSLAIPAAKQATRAIPIVMTVSGNPVGSGYVASLARPGGNITGLTNVAPDLVGKRLELLKEAVPGISRVAVLGTPNSPGKEIPHAARALNVRLQVLKVQKPAEFERAFEAAKEERAEALMVLPSPMTNRYRKRIVNLAARNRLPAMYALAEYAEVGGLMSYGPSIPDLQRRAAVYVDKILKGAKPADLPVEQPTRFELVINQKTAKQIGLTIPPSLLVRADKIIE
jgi:putative ABC transport system substrate-binding protein